MHMSSTLVHLVCVQLHSLLRSGTVHAGELLGSSLSALVHWLGRCWLWQRELMKECIHIGPLLQSVHVDLRFSRNGLLMEVRQVDIYIYNNVVFFNILYIYKHPSSRAFDSVGRGSQQKRMNRTGTLRRTRPSLGSFCVGA